MDDKQDHFIQLFCLTGGGTFVVCLQYVWNRGKLNQGTNVLNRYHWKIYATQIGRSCVLQQS